MYKKRITQLRTAFKKNNIDAILVSSQVNIIYLTGFTNFSTEERESYVLITKEHIYVITDARYTEAVSTLIPYATILKRTPSRPLSQILQQVKKDEDIRKVGFEDSNLTVTEYITIRRIFTLIASDLIEQLRLIKSKKEIQFVQDACELGDKTFSYVLSRIKENITEKQLAREIAAFIRSNGAEISFQPIVCFGKTSSDIHHMPTENKLTKNNFILLDFGVKLNNYCSDMTRTIFLGKPDARQKNMHQTVLESQQKAIDYISALLEKSKSSTKNFTGADIDKIARDFIKTNGFEPFPHGLGHGTGLKVHEKPSISPLGTTAIQNGMVFSVEPGIYTPGFGGVRIEDLVVLVDNTVKILTNSPKNLIQL